jgi:predicted small secreted protein
MNIPLKNIRLALTIVITAVAFMTAGCSTSGMKGGGRDMTSAAALTGAQEVPATSTGASGKSTIHIMADKSVSGIVVIDGMNATAAHIHQGAKGANGPVIVPLVKTSDNTFTVPENAHLTDAQYDSYKNGDLYVNVHSAAYPGGEIRLQLAGE